MYAVIREAHDIPRRLAHVATHSEYNFDRLREKLNEIYWCSNHSLFRCNFWFDIARIERILGNELIAVTYELRILRLLGDDKLNLLPQVVQTLEKHGFQREAEAARAMYEDPVKAKDRVHNYLQQAYVRNKSRRDKPWFSIADYRTGETPRVSVIVSLYKAEEKLTFFLDALRQQTLAEMGQVEIILVDSGSPTGEKVVVERYRSCNPLNIVYARSEDRETIQAAWNRGIGLATAPYLVFLGVDEALYPKALEVLANELDQHPNVDWVMANSLVTAVEENGVYKHDIMSYDRMDTTKDHAYLETCYLSWVGGMYRANLHDRFGFYDESFGAAGDTEFKNRILPFIDVKFFPRVLGLFLNYPDGQTTASPKAEIEDLRAWYIHRTEGGVKYAFDSRAVEEAESLMALCLGYRKSYCKHISTDIEYGNALAAYLTSRMGQAPGIADDLKTMQDLLRGIEFTDKPIGRFRSVAQLFGVWWSFQRYERAHRENLDKTVLPVYSMLNDNRYEQHSWLWKL